MASSRQKRVFKKIATLLKKRQKCLDYSSAPNQCHAYYSRLIQQQKLKLRGMQTRQTMDRANKIKENVVDLYLNFLSEDFTGAELNKARKLGPIVGPVYLKKLQKRKMMATTEAEGMKDLPRGWTQKSLKKYSKSLTGKKGTQKGFFDKCVERMRGKVKNPEGFCASVKDELHGSTYWRGKGKTPQQAGKDVKRMQNVQRG